MKNILLTGYRPFDQFDYNPSDRLALALDGRKVGRDFTIHSVVMPVDTVAMPGILAGLLEDLQPALVVGLGLAFGDTGIRIERIGHNWVEFVLPDNGGNVRPGNLLFHDAPAAYFSTLPVVAMVERLVEAGIPAYTSDHAGTHLCNQMLYTALYLAARLPPARAPGCGFIHLPATPDLAARMSLENPPRRAASMDLTLMQKAVLIALEQAALAGAGPLRS